MGPEANLFTEVLSTDVHTQCGPLRSLVLRKVTVVSALFAGYQIVTKAPHGPKGLVLFPTTVTLQKFPSAQGNYTSSAGKELNHDYFFDQAYWSLFWGSPGSLPPLLKGYLELH